MYKEKQCVICGKITKNPKFCSRSCSTTSSNNTRDYSKIYKNHCKSCNCKITVDKTYCLTCKSGKQEKLLNRKIKEVIYSNLHKSSAFALIRTNARYLFRKHNKQICSKCGYNKHIEVCHIKGIADFNEDSLISEVNSLSNLIGLCPNCHWEFDNL